MKKLGCFKAILIEINTKPRKNVRLNNTVFFTSLSIFLVESSENTPLKNEMILVETNNKLYFFPLTSKCFELICNKKLKVWKNY